MAELPNPTMRSPSQWPGTARSAASAGRWLIRISGAMQDLPRPRRRARGTRSARPERPPGAQAGGQLAAQRSPALHVQRLVDGFVADAHGLIIGEVEPQAAGGMFPAPCRGPEPGPPAPLPGARPRPCRPPSRRPFHGTTGPRTAAPFGAMMTPASRSCTYRRSGSLIASLADFGRRAERSACHGAVVARYARPPLRVAALRRSSREIVDGARFSWRAISRTPCRCARQIAISSRSANDRERPDSGFAARARWDGGMPPVLRNQRAPTAGDTPVPTAASSLEPPAAINTQN